MPDIRDTNAVLEPEITLIDPDNKAPPTAKFIISAAISLKRIADILEASEKRKIEFYSMRDNPNVKF